MTPPPSQRCSTIAALLMRAKLGFRVVAFGLLAYSAFWVAAYRGLWYDSHVFARKSSAFEFSQGDFYASGGKARVLVFFVAPILLAAICGACFEAASAVARDRRAQGATPPTTSRIRGSGNSTSSIAGNDQGGDPGKPRLIWTLLHYNFRPFGEGSPWVTLGEALALGTYIFVMITMVWQGVIFKLQAHLDDTMVCEDDPSSRCKIGTDSLAISSSVIVLKNAAKYLGFAAAIQFSLVLVPVSRDSKIWSAIGVPFERAVLYHTALGHLSFVSLFLHGALYMAYYVIKHGWEYAFRSAFHYKGHGVNVPAGFIAGLCALPMWILSLNFFRRRYYRLFKTSHFLFIGVFGGGMVHYDGFVYYLLAGFALYLAHAVSRLGNWNWWTVFKQCSSRGAGPAGVRGCKTTCCSLVHLHSGDEYTRLILRCPRSSSHGLAAPKGGELVYISAPALLGTIEAHPMSVALRGTPPCLWNKAFHEDQGEVFTLYVKTAGSWTRALQKQEGDNLAVHVDGFYGGMSPLSAAKSAEGFPRVLLFAGGSGVTSFTSLIQDWCEAYSNGEDVPEVHLIWSCRRLPEIELLGEALPSYLAAVPAGAESRFKMSLFCSGQRDGDDPAVISWPVLAMPDGLGPLHGRKISHEVLDSLNHGMRTVIAGGGAVIGWLWAENLAKGSVMLGMADLVLMTVVPACLLVLYGFASRLVFGVWITRTPFSATARKRYVQLRETSGAEEDSRQNQLDEGLTALGGSAGVESATKKAYSVSPGHVPVHDVLLCEEEIALREGFGRVKVLVSGPGGMVDTVMTETRKVSWRLFDVETASREY
ncbi:unnamed protein product [Scytosiphon promiscuus]